MKIIGTVLLLISGISIAFILTYEQERALRCARALLALLNFTKDSVELYSMSNSEIIEKCEKSVIIECGYPSDASMPKSFFEMSERCEIPDKECATAFREFANDFGKSYRMQEIKRCEGCIERLRKRETELSAILPVKKKMIYGVSVCIALMILILLL